MCYQFIILAGKRVINTVGIGKSACHHFIILTACFSAIAAIQQCSEQGHSLSNRIKFQSYFSSIQTFGKWLLGEIERNFNSLSPQLDENFQLNIENLLKKINHGSFEVVKIGRWHNALTFIHYMRFWFVEFSIPVVVSLIGLWLSGFTALQLLSDVWNTL